MKATIKTLETLSKLGFKDISEEDERTYSFYKSYRKEGVEYGFAIVEFYKSNSVLTDELGEINFHSALKPFQDVAPMVSCFYDFQKDMEALNATVSVD